MASPITSAALHVLVNNAGIAGVNKPTHEVTEEEWDRVQAVNVKGVFFCTKHAIPHLRRAGGGSIINLSSIYGLVGARRCAAVSRVQGRGHADEQDRCADLRCRPDPGELHPPGLHLDADGRASPARQWRDRPEAARREVASLHPLGHMGEPDDIAWGVVYLASDEAKFVTGSELVIDGGYTAR